MTDIKFGTDGWRAIIAKEYTIDNLGRVSEATAKFMLEKGYKKAVIGYDCRFAGEMFAQHASTVLASMGIEVEMHDGICTTPMVSLAAVVRKADMGIVITASHNPASYSGFKLKSSYGGPTVPADIAHVERLIPDQASELKGSFVDYMATDKIRYIDMKKIYIDRIEENFDMKALQEIAPNVAYDAMFGAGFVIMNELFPNMKRLHSHWNPNFEGQAPEPIHRNLAELSELLRSDSSLKVGFANDGDADRIGMYDEWGNFVDSHHLLLLLTYYLHKYKGLNGKVVTTFSVTDKLGKLAALQGHDFEVTKIGFKYIAEIMIKEDIMVGGEESGGLAVKGHVPERDGIWIALIILEFMSKTGKKLSELIQEVYDLVGSFAFDRYDLHITDSLKQRVIEKCMNDPFTELAGKPVQRIERIDGTKFYLDDDRFVMIRPSGTEPVLRVYCQAPDQKEVIEILDQVEATLRSC